MGQSRMRIANWWYSRKDYSIAVKCYKKALQFYNNIPTNQVEFYNCNSCSSVLLCSARARAVMVFDLYIYQPPVYYD